MLAARLILDSQYLILIVMDNMAELLGRKGPQEPKQIAALKQYAKDKYDIAITVRVTKKYYQIKVPNGALAHRVRVDTVDIMDVCELDKPLVIQIGY